MKSGRQLTSALLLLAALSASAMMPSGVGQSLTTFLETVTTQVEVTGTVTSTVGSTQGLSTQVQMQTYSTPFVVDATYGRYGCIYKTLRLTANEGDQISGQITSNSEISFYVMSSNDYRTWVNENLCSVRSSFLGEREVTSLLLDMIAPYTGEYVLLFLNSSIATPANVVLVFVSLSQTVTTISLPVVSAFLLTETYLTTHTLEEVRPVETWPLFDEYAILIAAILGLIVVLLVLQRRSRKKITAVTIPARPAPITGKFCGNCGAPLPLSAQFCDRCGAPDEENA